MEENKEIQQIGQENPPLCGGVPKPPLPPGKYGDHICEDNEWVFIPSS